MFETAVMSYIFLIANNCPSSEYLNKGLTNLSRSTYYMNNSADES